LVDRFAVIAGQPQEVSKSAKKSRGATGLACNSYLKESRQVEDDGKDCDERDVSLELEPGKVLRAADQVGDEADPDVPLPAKYDGAVNRRHKRDLDEGQEDGHEVRKYFLRVVLPKVGEAVHEGACHNNLG
jgi:hypothetical protein